MSARGEVMGRFLQDIASHEMQVVRSEGVERRLRFKRPGTMCMHFDIVTWPGILVITGDMGTSVFTRIEDMFEFFRAGPETRARAGGLYVNPGYWAEKCIANDGEKEEFRPELFEAAVKERFDNYFEGEELTPADEIAKAELWEEIESTVLPARHDGAYAAGAAARDFQAASDRFKRFNFDEFYEARVTDYTFHFTWRLYAIAYAIEQFDAWEADQAQVRG